jgi:hypothetical protein
VDDALRVRGVQSVGNLDRQVEQRLGLKRLPLDAVLECLAFQQLHVDEGLTLVLIDGVNRTDIGVIESRCSRGLAPETFQCLVVLSERLW